MNIEQFSREIRAIGRSAEADMGPADYRHMRLVGLSGRVSSALALLSCWFGLVWLAVPLFAFGLLVRWLLMHHVGHGGYDRLQGIPAHFRASRYGEGWRRYIDWFDWIDPAAWKHEHNKLHHFYTGEEQDPDLVEANLHWLANSRLPVPLKFAVLLFFAATWKFTYYAARTLSYTPGHGPIGFSNFLDIRQPTQRAMLFRLFLPYVVIHFIAIPVLLEFIHAGFGWTFLLSRLLAELLHNVHTFVLIVPNHCGDDLYRFTSLDRSERTASRFYVRQILGSANYRTGHEWLDLSQMYLNYQIEHHLFPNLSMLQYRKIQPRIKQVCECYGVPYVQGSLSSRVWKMAQIALGLRRMKVASTTPWQTVDSDAQRPRCEAERSEPAMG